MGLEVWFECVGSWKAFNADTLGVVVARAAYRGIWIDVVLDHDSTGTAEDRTPAGGGNGIVYWAKDSKAIDAPGIIRWRYT